MDGRVLEADRWGGCMATGVTHHEMTHECHQLNYKDFILQLVVVSFKRYYGLRQHLLLIRQCLQLNN